MNKIKLLPLLLILLGVAMRLVPHPANFAPITAIALFGGMYLPKKYAFILPLLAVFISDLFLGFDKTTIWFVYGSFILSGLIGLYIRNHKAVSSIIAGTVFASVAFFLITNFAVWFNPVSSYTKDFKGLIDCYVAGIPFYRNTLLGDLFFTGLFVGGYEFVTKLGRNYVSKLF
jgi:hypothetical protein